MVSCRDIEIALCGMLRLPYLRPWKVGQGKVGHDRLPMYAYIYKPVVTFNQTS